jgi:hypothetical protein
VKGYALEAVLARSARAHGLVEPAGSVEAALVRAAGLYGTAPTSHLGLAVRLGRPVASELERATQVDRSIVRVPAMRGSVFLLPKELAPSGLALSRPNVLRRTLNGAGLDDDELDRLGDRIEARLGEGPLPTREVRAALGAEAPPGERLTMVMRLLAHEGRIVATHPTGGRAETYAWARMSDWVALPGPAPTIAEALTVLAPIWMRANGPGSIDDLAWWAGVSGAQAASALKAMRAREVAVEGLATPQLASDEVLAELDARGQAPQVVRPPPMVRLLPMWDAWLMARRDRTRILDDRWKPFVVDRGGNVTNAIVVDGRVVGTWDVDGGRLLIATFETPELLEAIEAAAARLRPELAWEAIEASDPRPLDVGGQNAFRAPLRDAARSSRPGAAGR